MPEHNPEQYEAPERSPLQQLHSDFESLCNQTSVEVSLQKYVKDELEIEEQAANSLIYEMRQRGVFPSDELYETDPTTATELYRLTIFTHILPLYRSMYTTDEYEQWLPHALTVSMPDNSRHDVEICLRRNGETDDTCEWGICPIKVIANTTEHELITPDFDSYDYLVDEDKACRAAYVTLSAVVKHRFIPAEQKRQLESCYENRYDRKFPASR